MERRVLGGNAGGSIEQTTENRKITYPAMTGGESDTWSRGQVREFCNIPSHEESDATYR